MPITITAIVGITLSILDRLTAQEPPATPALDNLDAELLKELGGALPDDVGEDIGKSSTADDPSVSLERIESQMRSAQRLLADKDASGRVSRLQEAIVEDLDALIKDAYRRQRQSQQGGKSSPGSQRSESQPPGSPSGKSDREGDQPAGESTDELRQGESGGAAATDLRAMREQVLKNLWGHLPERVREQMLQSQDDEFLPKYELEIEQYFRRLAEDPHLDGR
jgi:hypothetical protein